MIRANFVMRGHEFCLVSRNDLGQYDGHQESVFLKTMIDKSQPKFHRIPVETFDIRSQQLKPIIHNLVKRND